MHELPHHKMLTFCTWSSSSSCTMVEWSSLCCSQYEVQSVSWLLCCAEAWAGFLFSISEW